MAQDTSNDYGYWVGNPRGGGNTAADKTLIEYAADLNILVDWVEGGYDWEAVALVELDGFAFLVKASGCSCNGAEESWYVETGPTSFGAVATFIEKGEYRGYSLPQEVHDQLLAEARKRIN